MGAQFLKLEPCMGFLERNSPFLKYSLKEYFLYIQQYFFFLNIIDSNFAQGGNKAQIMYKWIAAESELWDKIWAA